MARGAAGPFRSEQYGADSTITTKPAWLWSYTVSNTSGGPITLTLYDNAAGDTTNPIETCVVPNNQTQAVYPNGDTLAGLVVKVASWSGVKFGVRWAPR